MKFLKNNISEIRPELSCPPWNRWAYFAKAHVIASQGSTKWSGLLTIFGKYIFKWASILIIRAYNAGFFYRHNLLAYFKGIHESIYAIVFIITINDL